jgi:LysR family pca operon transcriptional activator
MDRRLKIRHVQCFVEASNSLHLADVSSKLNLTQAAVSKTISELEEIVGEPLIKRLRSGIKLTPAGVTFLHHAADGLNSFNKGLDALALSKRLSHRQIELRVGMLPAVASRFMAPALHEFFSKPHIPIRLALSTGYNSELFTRLHSGQIDLAIARIGSAEEMRELEFAPIYSEPMVMVFRDGHPLTGLSEAERVRQIHHYPFLLPPSHTRIRPIVERILLDLKIPTPSNIIETVSNTFGRAFLPKSDAIWIISSGVVEDLLKIRTLRLLVAPFEDTREPVGLIRRLDQELDKVAREISEILLDQTKFLR